MIPRQDITDVEFIDGVEEISYPSFTWKIDFEQGRMRGYVDDKQALEQAIYKEINTERYDYIIYDDNYGLELKDLYGKPKSYCYVILSYRIKECLESDDRVITVDNFNYIQEDSKGNNLSISFTVESIFGNIEIKEGFNFGRVQKNL